MTDSGNKPETLTTDPKLLASHSAWATAMKSPDHLKAWLDASGRRWMVMHSIDLVDALTHEGRELLQTLVFAYRDYRRTIKNGKSETMVHPDTKQRVTVELCKDETLETEELDRAIRYLVSQMYERNPSWALTNDPL